MKNEYVKPEMKAEEFSANSYVAACGDTEYGKYKFVCNAGGGVYGGVYQETNGMDGLQTKEVWDCGKDEDLFSHWHGLHGCKKLYDADTQLTQSSFHACNKSHEASTTSDFFNGYYVVGSTVTPVVIWKGENSDNVHCTANINRDSWTVVKS